MGWFGDRFRAGIGGELQSERVAASSPTFPSAGFPELASKGHQLNTTASVRGQEYKLINSPEGRKAINNPWEWSGRVGAALLTSQFCRISAPAVQVNEHRPPSQHNSN